jgi:hypothetical protein
VDKFLLIHYIKNSDAYLLALMLFQKIFVILVSAFVGAGFVYPYRCSGCSPVPPKRLSTLLI